jgi:hypothetical protein
MLCHATQTSAKMAPSPFRFVASLTLRLHINTPCPSLSLSTRQPICLRATPHRPRRCKPNNHSPLAPRPIAILHCHSLPANFPTMMPTTPAWGQPMQPPAYNAVQPRTTLQHANVAAPVQRPLSRQHAHQANKMPQANASASPAAGKPKKVEWPPAVREYVRRAFDDKTTTASNADMQRKLKETISFYAERNMLATIEWTTFPLPGKLLEDERKNALVSPTHNGFTNGLSSLHLQGPDFQANTSPSILKKRKSQDPYV